MGGCRGGCRRGRHRGVVRRRSGGIGLWACGGVGCRVCKLGVPRCQLQGHKGVELLR